jgi:membrane-anchored protein YejM (alkaline phosphatase superfamily)
VVVYNDAFFKWMKNTNKLENAILIFMSDHGPRYSEIQNTEIGRVSNLLPLFSVIIPDHIKSKYSHIHKNLKLNTERMTTAFDVYETLKDILNNVFQVKETK